MSDHGEKKSQPVDPLDLRQIGDDLKKLRNKLSNWINDTFNPPVQIPIPVRVRSR